MWSSRESRGAGWQLSRAVVKHHIARNPPTSGAWELSNCGERMDTRWGRWPSWRGKFRLIYAAAVNEALVGDI